MSAYQAGAAEQRSCVMTVSVKPSLGEYLTGVLTDIAPLRPFQLALLDAVDSALAAPTEAPSPMPTYDTATVTGYAVASEEISQATPGSPLLLSVIGEIGITSWHPVRLPRKGCFAIAAGAPLPAGADAVIPADWTDKGRVRVKVKKSAPPGFNVNKAGSQHAAGDKLADTGEIVNEIRGYSKKESAPPAHAAPAVNSTPPWKRS